MKFLYSSTILAIILALALGGFQAASAETEGSARITPPKPGIRKEAAEVRKDIRQAASSTRKNIIQTTKTEIKDLRTGINKENRASTSAAIRDIRQDRKEDLKANHASTTEALRANRASTTEAVKAKREGLLKDIKARKNDKKQKLANDARQRIEKVIGEIYAKLNTQIARLTRVDATLGAKIATLRTSGTDVTATEALYVTAQTAFAKAKVDVMATASVAHEQAATSTSKEILKGLAKTAETSIKTAAEAYKKVAESIRPFIKPEAEVNASSTASSTTTI